MIRNEFTGMIPAAIVKFEELLASAAALVPRVELGYGVASGQDSLFSWGVACRIQCKDMPALKRKAAAAGITWLSDEGDMAYTNGLTIQDFKTFRVNGNLELMPENTLFAGEV